MKKISESEWLVFNTIAEDHPASARQIIERLSESKWTEKTIKTLISRLCKKGFLGHRQEKNFFLYYPLIPRAQLILKEEQRFMGKVLDNVPFSMLCRLVDRCELSVEEVDELHRLLEQKRK